MKTQKSEKTAYHGRINIYGERYYILTKNDKQKWLQCFWNWKKLESEKYNISEIMQVHIKRFARER